MSVNKISKSLSNFNKKEIEQIFTTNKSRIKNKGLEIILAPKNLDFGRILVITPRLIGNAPKRNHIRRQLKSIFYQEKLFQGKYNYIIIVRKPALKLSYEELKNILTSHAL